MLKSKRSYAVAGTMCFLGIALLIVAWLTKIDRVSAGQAPKNDQAWEYSAVTRVDDIWDRVSGTTGASAIVAFFEAKAEARVEKIEYRQEPSLRRADYQEMRDNARMKAIAKLGTEGWEMVGVQVTGEKSSELRYLFKRLKR